MGGSLDEVSRAIGELQGNVENIKNSQGTIFDKLDVIHAEQTNQRVHTAKLSSKVGFTTAIVTCGIIEGIRIWLKSHF